MPPPWSLVVKNTFGQRAGPRIFRVTAGTGFDLTADATVTVPLAPGEVKVRSGNQNGARPRFGPALTVLREIDGILRHLPDLGIPVKQVDEVKAKLEGMRVATPGIPALTTAEL